MPEQRMVRSPPSKMKYHSAMNICCSRSPMRRSRLTPNEYAGALFNTCR